MTTAADVERLGANRCVNCDRPRATQHDYDTIPGGEGEHLCWADYESSCEPEDWRARALTAERERDEARAEVERLRGVVETLEDDFARRQAAHRCSTWDDGQGKCECNNLVRTVAERQREACAEWAAHGYHSAVGDCVRATPLVTEGDK